MRTTPNIYRQCNNALNVQAGAQKGDVNMNENEEKSTMDWLTGNVAATNESATANITGDFCKKLQRMSGSDAVTTDSMRDLVATGSFMCKTMYYKYNNTSKVLIEDPQKEPLVQISLHLYIRT